MKPTLVALVLFAAACQPRNADTGEGSANTPESSESTDAPVISAVRPDSAVLRDGAVATVTLVGTGFDGAQESPTNTVLFGTMTVASVRANVAGTAIRFTVPGERRTSEAPGQAIEQGSYTVRVRTAHGTSNAATLRVIR